jgi:hypothetical protein
MSIRSNKFDLGLQSSDLTLGNTEKFVVGEGTAFKLSPEDAILAKSCVPLDLLL